MGLDQFVNSVTSIFKSWKRKRGADDSTEEGSTGPNKKAKVNYTITPDARDLSRKKRFSYFVGEELPDTESRTVEYKAGGVLFTRDTLVTMIQKYACAFLNSEGGTLLAGVNDKGIVTGVNMSYDNWRTITYTVKCELERFRPAVPVSFYSLKQYPVMPRPGTSSYGSSSYGSTLCVVELKFHKGEEGQLYENGNHCVFLRRDGGVQGPLKPLEIKDLVISKYNLLLRERRDTEMNKIEDEVAKRKRLKEKNIEFITISP